jgi:hypothetical protein
MKTKVEELYEEWSGEDRHVNDCHPVHDSSQTIEFAEYYYNAMQELEKGYSGKIMTIGAMDIEQQIHLEEIQRLVKKHTPAIIIAGHNLPSAEVLIKLVEGIKDKHPEFLDSEKLFSEPIKIQSFREIEELPELYLNEGKKCKGYERPYRFHR